MNALAYLHSLWITHNKLTEIFSQNQDYEGFFQRLNIAPLWQYYDKAEKMLSILEAKETLDTKHIDSVLKKYEVQLITIHDEGYPNLLRNLTNPPYVLYVRGQICGDENCFSVVGSRKITPYAKHVSETLVPELSRYFTIVSGGAGGCDSLAHSDTMKAGWKTWAVFGTGIDIIYPTTNRRLFQEIVEKGGALISTFPIGTTGNPYNFPIRNEIVAWISKGVLVIEAWEKSGTIITANLALEQGKDVFAVPWDIFNVNYIGTNNLIKNWLAKLCMSSDDILEEYNFSILPNKMEVTFSNDVQKYIYTLLKYQSTMSIDEMLERGQYSYWEISLNLSLMELSRLISKDTYGKYSISFEKT